MVELTPSELNDLKIYADTEKSKGNGSFLMGARLRLLVERYEDSDDIERLSETIVALRDETNVLAVALSKTADTATKLEEQISDSVDALDEVLSAEVAGGVRGPVALARAKATREAAEAFRDALGEIQTSLATLVEQLEEHRTAAADLGQK